MIRLAVRVRARARRARARRADGVRARRPRGARGRRRDRVRALRRRGRAARRSATSGRRVGEALGRRLHERAPRRLGRGWRSFHRPLDVGPLRVRPPWEPPREGALDVVIDPGQAFGTGSHATTRLTLELLADAASPSGALADWGCGSGILAIAAAKLGWAPVLACDIEAESVERAREGAEANGVTLEVTRCDVRQAARTRRPCSPTSSARCCSRSPRTSSDAARAADHLGRRDARGRRGRRRVRGHGLPSRTAARAAAGPRSQFLDSRTP